MSMCDIDGIAPSMKFEVTVQYLDGTRKTDSTHATRAEAERVALAIVRNAPVKAATVTEYMAGCAVRTWEPAARKQGQERHVGQFASRHYVVVLQFEERGVVHSLHDYLDEAREVAEGVDYEKWSRASRRQGMLIDYGALQAVEVAELTDGVLTKVECVRHFGSTEAGKGVLQNWASSAPPLNALPNFTFCRGEVLSDAMLKLLYQHCEQAHLRLLAEELERTVAGVPKFPCSLEDCPVRCKGQDRVAYVVRSEVFHGLDLRQRVTKWATRVTRDGKVAGVSQIRANTCTAIAAVILPE